VFSQLLLDSEMSEDYKKVKKKKRIKRKKRIKVNEMKRMSLK
jgi:hypothetical protein